MRRLKLDRYCSPSRAVAAALAVAVALICSVAEAATTAKVAIAVSETASRAAYGGPSYDGALLAVEEANASGTGPHIELTIYDDASDPEKAKQIAHDVGASDAVVAIGPATTAMALPAGPIYAEAGVPAITPI